MKHNIRYFKDIVHTNVIYKLKNKKLYDGWAQSAISYKRYGVRWNEISDFTGVSISKILIKLKESRNLTEITEEEFFIECL